MSDVRGKRTPIISDPAGTFFWAGVWLAIGGIGNFLFFAAGGFSLFSTTTNYSDQRGLGLISIFAIGAPVLAIFLLIAAIRNIGRYRAQELTPEGIARREAFDAVAARRHYAVLFVFAILFSVVWVLMAGFVVLGVSIAPVDATTGLAFAFILLVFGLIAGRLLGAALGRRAARRRVAGSATGDSVAAETSGTLI